MQLWIRAKEGLFNVKGVHINAPSPLWEGKTDIVSDAGFLLGTYKTRGRALEILDEIQKALDDSDFFVFNNCEIADGTNLKDLMKEHYATVYGNGASIEKLNKNVIIYTMPEE